VGDVKVENRIGDAIVHRAIRAHQEGTPWKCCILIPVLPGFPFPIDHGDASAVSTQLIRVPFATLIYRFQIRIIVECQNRTICRGPNSIFGRLRKEGIDVSVKLAWPYIQELTFTPSRVTMSRFSPSVIGRNCLETSWPLSRCISTRRSASLTTGWLSSVVPTSMNDLNEETVIQNWPL
jgi:hypothetical protein